MPYLSNHFYIISGAFVKTSRFKLACLLTEKLHLVAQVKLHPCQRRSLALPRSDKQVGRIDFEHIVAAQRGIVERVQG